MNARIKILTLVCLLIFVIIFLVVCAPKRPIILEKVFSHPDGDYDLYSYGRDGVAGGEKSDQDIVSWE